MHITAKKHVLHTSEARQTLASEGVDAIGAVSTLMTRL